MKDKTSPAGIQLAFVEQLRAFNEHGSLPGIASLLASTVILTALWPEAPRAATITWAIAAYAFGIASLLISLRYPSVRPVQSAQSHRVRIIALFAATRGLLLGALAGFLPYISMQSEMILLVAVLCLASTAVIWLFSFPWAARAYVLAAFLPWLVAFAFSQFEHRAIIALLTAMMMGILLRSINVIYRTVYDSVEARRDALDLVAELESSRQDWQEISDHAEAFAVFDQDMKLLLWTAQYGEILDIPREALQRGADMTALRKLGAKPIDVAFEEKTWEEWLSETRASFGDEPSEFIHLLANGRWLRTTVSKTSRGNFAALHIDVTELKNREEALLQATHNLEQQAAEIRNAYHELEEHHRRIELTSRDLTLARDEALRADRAKTEFLANMSHELRTPLNAIIGFSQMMEEEIFGPLGAPNYHDYAHNIAESGEHLLRLINEILDLSKVAAGKMELQVSDVSVARLIDGCTQILGSLAANKRISLTVKGDHASWPLLDADGMKIKQSLLNLMSNALKFTLEGGSITVSTQRRENGDFEIAVRDSGVGMREEDIPLVMEPFRRLSSAYDGAYQGTGLGLPLARAFVELHGGSLQITSQINKGTVVIISLPAHLAIDEDQVKPSVGYTI